MNDHDPARNRMRDILRKLGDEAVPPRSYDEIVDEQPTDLTPVRPPRLERPRRVPALIGAAAAVVLGIGGLAVWATGDDGSVSDEAPIGTAPTETSPAATGATSVPADADEPGIFDELAMMLQPKSRVVASGRTFQASLLVMNPTDSPVTDPSCQLAAHRSGLIPDESLANLPPDTAGPDMTGSTESTATTDGPVHEDAMAATSDLELEYETVVDCEGPRTIEPGDELEIPVELHARSISGEDLPPGDYLAAVEIDGRTDRVAERVRVHPPPSESTSRSG